MSPSADRGPSRRDAGFTLIEIIVALGVLTVVMVALLPQLVVGIRASGTARLVTQAKGVAQGELERVRNLPFHIAPAAGSFVDLLDRYYPDRTAPTGTGPCRSGGKYTVPTTGWGGYVTAGSAARCDYEPGSGSFYRTVHVLPAEAGRTTFTVVTDAQFLSGATPPVAVDPGVGYDSRVTGRDNPAASQMGVTVTVFYSERGTPRPVSMFTQVAGRLPSSTRLRARADVRAVEVGSVTVDPASAERVPLSLSAGLVNLTSAVSYASTVTANRTAASAGLGTGDKASGASGTASAPPATALAPLAAPAGQLASGGCAYACWGGSQLPAMSLSADQGLPVAGTSTAPAQALLTDGSQGGISFGNTTDPSAYRPGLALAPPLVTLDTSLAPQPSGLSGCAPGATGTPALVAASGYLRTTATDDSAAPSNVESCAVARAVPVELFPTSFAPRGVVRVELVGAAAQCLVQGAAHTASTHYDYRAIVEYYDGSTYRTAATVVPGMTSDPLDAVPLTTPVGGGKTLGDYVASWSSLSTGKVATTEAGGVAEVTLPGVVTIASQPTRLDPSSASGYDESSVVSLTVGAMTCHAEDSR